MAGLLEWFVRMIAWAIQIGAVLFIAFLLAAVVQAAEEFFRKKKVKFWPRLLAVFLLVCVILAGFALRPPVVCDEKLEARLDPAWRETVRSVSNGLYSWNIPLVPVCVHITGLKNFVIDGEMEHVVEFEIWYFCCGRRVMEYSTYDGFYSYPMFGS